MGKTSIEWLQIPGYKAESWNPVTGCTPRGRECKNCYAVAIAKRWWGDRPFSDVQCHEDRLSTPLHWRKPRACFVNSMSDLFHADVPQGFIERTFKTISRCRESLFFILTKRYRRMEAILASIVELPWWPLENVWIGISAGTQRNLELALPYLLRTHATNKFISFEPLIEPLPDGIGLFGTTPKDWGVGYASIEAFIDWCAIGGESGPRARSLHLETVRKMIMECQIASVPVFVKQLGTAWAKSVGAKDYKGADPSEWPADIQVREYPDPIKALMR